MPARIVCVDDEPKVLRGLRRRIGRDFDVATAESGSEALELIRSRGPFPVVVSDMRMPGMSGAEFLGLVRREFPDTIRILLTGQADMSDAIAAVNEGHIFRFLTKPCPPEILLPALDAAVEQYRLVKAERELLEGTVRGTIALLTEILGINDPGAFNRGTRLKQHMRRLTAELGVGDTWDFEVAAMLSQVGDAIVPGDIVRRARRGAPLTAEERKLLEDRPRVTRDLLANIPRLDRVAAMIGALGEPGGGPGFDDHHALGVRLLRAVLEFDAHLERGMKEGAAVGAMRHSDAGFDPEVLHALDRMVIADGGYVVKELRVAELVSGLVLAADLHSSDGRLLLTEGTEVSMAARTRIAQYAEHVGVEEPILVRLLV
jgi:CheY-like chemotaxis protein